MGDGTKSRSSDGWTKNSLRHGEGDSYVSQFRMGKQQWLIKVEYVVFVFSRSFKS